MSAARVLQRATTGGVDNSFTETLDKQGMSEQDLDCQGKKILFVGDSVGHTANLKYIETSMRCQLESLRAYSSVMDQNARWPSKNFNDVITNHLRGQKEFNVVVMSAPTVDISNLNLEKLSRSQCEERAINTLPLNGTHKEFLCQRMIFNALCIIYHNKVNNGKFEIPY